MLRRAAALLPLAVAACDAGPAGRRPSDRAPFVVDSAARTVRLHLVAGADSANSGLNFNGAAAGRGVITVPEGWTVVVTLVNVDAGLTHSAVLLEASEPLPSTPGAPSFAHAATAHSETGLAKGESATFSFEPDRQGSYVIACGVTGHAQTGMWVRFDVTSPAVPPTYR